MSDSHPNAETPDRFSDPNKVVGVSDKDTHRAGPDEGVRAPLAKEGADHPEFSVFDGAGNETVVAVTANDEGKIVQSTGATSEEALKAAGNQDERLGKGFGPVDDHR
ncbi:MAG: hypothetical protein ACR2HY_03825 [Acidimicrobiales bacterium]